MTCQDRPQDASNAVLYWREGSIAHLRFNRPQAFNAFNPAFAAAFLEACEAIAGDAGVRVVSLSAEGRVFTVGGDLASMRESPRAVSEQLVNGMHGGLRLLAGLDAPVIGRVQGAVAGGGLGVMLGCDLVVAEEGTRFRFAYPAIGASCDCSTSWGLPRMLGLRKAMEIALLPGDLDAAEALRLGLVNRVVPADRLSAETDQIVQRLAQGPTRAFGELKRLMRASLQNDLGTHLDAEAEAFVKCAETKDFAEGIEAFLAKRPAAFHGH